MDTTLPQEREIERAPVHTLDTYTISVIDAEIDRWQHNSELELVLESAKDLTDKDNPWRETTNQYCKIQFLTCSECDVLGNKHQMQAVTSTKEALRKSGKDVPEWNFKYTTSDWSPGDRVNFDCYDEDTEDELGSGTLVLDDPDRLWGKRYWVPLSRGGQLQILTTVKECQWDCSNTITTMAKIAKAVYAFQAQADNYHLIAQANVAGPDPDFNQEDHMAIYKKYANEGETTPHCALAFSGTNERMDWMSNLNFVETEACGYTVHSGWLKELQNYFKSAEMARFSKIIHKYCGGEVYTVGHSLGGAVASLVAGCINRPDGIRSIPSVHPDTVDFKVTGLYTVGAPGVSKEQITGRNGECIDGARIFNHDQATFDPVPWLAGQLDYVHPKTESYELRDIWSGLEKNKYLCTSSEAAHYPYGVIGLKRPSTQDHFCTTYIERLLQLLPVS